MHLNKFKVPYQQFINRMTIKSTTVLVYRYFKNELIKFKLFEYVQYTSLKRCHKHCMEFCQLSIIEFFSVVYWTQMLTGGDGVMRYTSLGGVCLCVWVVYPCICIWVCVCVCVFVCVFDRQPNSSRQEFVVYGLFLLFVSFV